MEHKLCGKIVKNVCYLNMFDELVSYELVGPRGGVMQAIRYPNSDYYYLRNGNMSICALAGNSTLTDKTGMLNIASV